MCCNMKCSFKYLIFIIFLFCGGCVASVEEQNLTIAQEDMATLLDRYCFQMYPMTKAEINDDIASLKTIETIEQLQAVLEYISNVLIVDQNKCLEHSQTVDPEMFYISSLQSRSESSQVVISGNSKHGVIHVYLDPNAPCVTNSAFYLSGIWDAFIRYEHMGGGAERRGELINFNARGDVILNISGYDFQRLPTSSVGYYDLSSR